MSDRFGSIPVVYSPYCEKGTATYLDGVIYAHSAEDLAQLFEDGFDRGFLLAMGIQP